MFLKGERPETDDFVIKVSGCESFVKEKHLVEISLFQEITKKQARNQGKSFEWGHWS